MQIPGPQRAHGRVIACNYNISNDHEHLENHLIKFREPKSELILSKICSFKN